MHGILQIAEMCNRKVIESRLLKSLLLTKILKLKENKISNSYCKYSNKFFDCKQQLK